MNIREEIERKEALNLSDFALLSRNSRGRCFEEEKCSIRTEFQRDRDRIIHSKAFRRLKHKTQVFLSPGGDHFRTRLTHTLEVAQIGRTIGRALALNEDLIEAIALGHDLGHTPFGHTGEKVLNKLNPKGFRHNEQSLRLVEILEHGNDRQGLNLTYEVKEGIIKHSGELRSFTLEGQIVKFADRIAYINHDIDDAIRAEIISDRDLPKDCIKVLGNSHGSRINNMIIDIVYSSRGKNQICMTEDINDKMLKLREFMFENVYYNKRAKKEDEKAEYIVEEIYKYYFQRPDKLPEEYRRNIGNHNFSIEDIICDYIAGMTDRYIVNLFTEIFIPKPWEK